MNERLPALPAQVEIEPRRSRPQLRRWLGSPLGAAAAELAPDLLRMVGRSVVPLAERRAEAERPQAGANGVTVSEVEIDLAAPFVRRVVVRTAQSWSVSPEVLQAPRRKRRRSRIGLGAVSVAGLAMLGYAASRRLPLALPSRVRQDNP